MAHKITEIYFLTSVEYALLLAGMGVKQIYMLQSGQVDIDEGKICLAMNHLYQTGLIDSRKEAFVIREDLKELLNGIKEAEYAVFVRSGFREKQAICCFSILEHSSEQSCAPESSLENFVTVQLSETDADSYQIYHMDETEFTEKIQDEFLDSPKYQTVPKEECRNRKWTKRFSEYGNYEQILESQKYEPVLEEEAMYQEIRKSQNSISKEDIRKYHNISLIAEQIEMKSGKVKKKLLVRLTPEGRCLEVLDSGKSVMECKSCEEADILEAIKCVSKKHDAYMIQ